MKNAVEIITVGNELLNGLTVDSNSSWLCKQITGLGGNVQRVVLIPDEVEQIESEIKGALANSTSLVVTVGGLGMTADDLTLEGVARATDREIAEDPDALKIVRRRYDTLYSENSVDSPDLIPERRKMAHLPQGAEPLDQNTGAAPGVFLRVGDRSAVVSLPGVPAEMKDIFENSLRPYLRRLFGAAVFTEATYTTTCKDESILAPPLRDVAEANSDVYVKSRSQKFGSDVAMQVTLAARGDDKSAVLRRLGEVRDELARALSPLNIEVSEDGGPRERS